MSKEWRPRKKKSDHPGWVRDIEAQCRAAGKPHFFKQAHINEKGVSCEEAELDGQVVQEFPELARRLALSVL